MGAVFISYRRGDSEGQARALSTELEDIIGKDSVFMDVDSIGLGRDFRHVLQESLQACDLMLALIGPNWLDAKDASGRRRLDNPRDYVRQEIAAALKRNIPVVPVLIQGARVPEQETLPEDIQDLAYRNGIEISHTRWKSDVRELVSRLGLGVQPPVPPRTETPQIPAPVISRPAVDSAPIPVTRVPPAPAPESTPLFPSSSLSASIQAPEIQRKDASSTPATETSPSRSPISRGEFEAKTAFGTSTRILPVGAILTILVTAWFIGTGIISLVPLGPIPIILCLPLGAVLFVILRSQTGHPADLNILNLRALSRRSWTAMIVAVAMIAPLIICIGVMQYRFDRYFPVSFFQGTTISIFNLIFFERGFQLMYLAPLLKIYASFLVIIPAGAILFVILRHRRETGERHLSLR